MASLANQKKTNFNVANHPLFSRVIGDGTAANSGTYEDWISPAYGFNAPLDPDPRNNVFAIIR